MNDAQDITGNDVAAPSDLSDNLEGDSAASESAPVEDTIPSTEDLLQFEQVDPGTLETDPLIPVNPDYTIPFTFIALLGILFGLGIFAVLSKRWSA